MAERGHVLLVGDERKLSPDLRKVLGKRGFEVTWAGSCRDALLHLGANETDVVVTEVVLPDGDAIGLCERIADNHRDLPVLVLAEQPTLDTSVAALRAGAYDYLAWPTPMEALALALDRAITHRRLRREVRRLRHVLEDGARYDEIIGESPVMREVFDTLARVAGSRASVLVTGETGTGKELIARALHRGVAPDAPFVAVNCSAIPETLLESELFGHAKGAFTDAKSARQGLFAKAHGGTLFLDEIGDMPLVLQAKILRALQDKVVRPVGSETEVPFKARVIAATNRVLEAMVDEGSFRADLYYRLNVIHIDLPPLRSRGGDILLLAQYFLDRAAETAGREIKGLSPGAARRLLEYRWPGNIRELENCIERAVAFSSHDEIAVDDLPVRLRNYKPSHVIVASSNPGELVPLRIVEERYVRRVLEAVGGNKARAAKALGIERKTLYRKLERWGMGGESDDES
jgi:two-component system response regulator AtoC